MRFTKVTTVGLEKTGFDPKYGEEFGGIVGQFVNQQFWNLKI